MKFFLLIILFALFVLIAIGIYLYFLYRSRLFADLDYIARYLKNNIIFNKNNLNILLTNSFDKISATSRYILKNTSSPFSKIILRKDYSTLNNFFKSLGKGDVTFEVGNLDYYINIFENLKLSTNADMKNKAMVYFKLTIGLGLIVCILLI